MLRFLNRLFLNVQLHKGHMKMVHKAAESVSPSNGTGWQEALSLNQPRPLVGKLPCALMTFPSCLTALFPWGSL